jgi:SnoaL-like domain
MSAQKLVIGAALVALAAPLAAYGGWRTTSGPSLQKTADLYAIEKIEKIWHRSTSKKNLNLMMSLWAPDGVMTNGGKTYTGKKAIRSVLAKSAPFQAVNPWVSDTPAYKTRVTVTGNKGTIYFECHYIDVDTSKVAAVVGADLEVRKIAGKWLITHMSGSTVTLKP